MTDETKHTPVPYYVVKPVKLFTAQDRGIVD